MCNPALIAGGLALAGTATSAYGQYQSGKYNEQVAKNNAKLEDWKAKDAIARGKVDIQNKEMETALRLGRARAQAAAQGGVVDTGSNLIALQDTAGAGQMDVNTIRSNMQREAYTHQANKTSLLAQGKLAKREGKMGAISTLLSGGSQAIGMMK